MDFEKYNDDDFCVVAEGIIEDIILEAGRRLYDLPASSDENTASIRGICMCCCYCLARLNRITQQLSGIQYMNQAYNMKRNLQSISSGKTSITQFV